jgi:hypothetical protein
VPSIGTVCLDDGRCEERRRGGEPRPQVLPEVGHAGDIGDASLVHPLKELARMERAAAEGDERALELVALQAGQIDGGWAEHGRTP